MKRRAYPSRRRPVTTEVTVAEAVEPWSGLLGALRRPSPTSSVLTFTAPLPTTTEQLSWLEGGK